MAVELIESHKVTEQLQIQVHGDESLATLIYFPGLHGDWTLAARLREQLRDKVRFVEFTYPRTLTWTLDDYAREIVNLLSANGIQRGWILAESFGSQLAWPVAANYPENFRAQGVIFAGGFGRHPFGKLLKVLGAGPAIIFRVICKILFVNPRLIRPWRWLHKRPAGMPEWLKEFLARRTPEDIDAAAHRLRLLAANDPTPLAAKINAPIFYLSGGWDAVVPYWFVNRWMKKHCKSFKETRVLWNADHVVLLVQPKLAAEQILKWIEE